ncbi:hypothetical protein ACGTJS_02325 [Faucicola mancuniensis]|uniref:hypothetical protein n=1 Tax=Faucicola mancuniensis TaxID=1309795 RepID=UPI0039773730
MESNGLTAGKPNFIDEDKPPKKPKSIAQDLGFYFAKKLVKNADINPIRIN